VLSVRRLSKSLAGGLFADAEHGSDLRPGPTVRARLGDLIGEPKVAGGDGMKCLADGSQVLSAGLG
jgi:hypothetical protein